MLLAVLVVFGLLMFDNNSVWHGLFCWIFYLCSLFLFFHWDGDKSAITPVRPVANAGTVCVFKALYRS